MKDKKLKWIADDSAYYKVDEECFLEDNLDTSFSEMVFFAGMPHLWIDHFAPGNIRSTIFTAINKSFHIAWVAIPNYGYSLFSISGSRHHRASLSYYKNSIETAAKMKANGMILIPSGGMLDRDMEEQRECCISMLTELEKTAEEAGIELVLGAGVFPDSVCMTTLGEMKKVYETLPGLKFMLDTHTVFLNGDTIQEWFEEIGNRIVHIRLQAGQYPGTDICGQEGCAMKRILSELAENCVSQTIAVYMQSELYAREPGRISLLSAKWKEEFR